MVGALGTLTLVMMARTARQRCRQELDRFKAIGVAALLVSLAAILRLSVPQLGEENRLLLLWSSAAAWSAAFGLLFRHLWDSYRRA
jgi:uncharacterized protein involved in response to NO